MKKIFILTTIIFLLSLFTVYANITWWQEANSDYLSVGGNSFVGYASNYAQQQTNYSQCTFGINTNFSSVAGDFLLRGYPQIVVSDAQNVYLYDTDCTLLGSINIGEIIQSQPVITNYLGASTPQIIVLSSTKISVLTYDGTNLVLNKAISTPLTYAEMTCLFQNKICYALQSGSKDLAEINLTNSVITNHTAMLSYNFNNYPNFNSLSNSRIQIYTGSYVYYTVVCNMNSGIGTAGYCDILNTNILGTLTKTATISITGFGAVPLAIRQINAFIANLGTSPKIFISVCDGVRGGFNNIYDTSGTLVYTAGFNAYCNNGASSTNFEVSDFNKDGKNEACYIENEFAVSPSYTHLVCINSNYNEIIDYYFPSPLIYRFSLSSYDFNHSRPELGVIISDGVYYYNGSTLSKEYDTGVNGTSIQAKVGVTFTSSSGLNGFWFSGNSQSLIVYPTLISAVCGNNICENLENSLTCPNDCSYNSSSLQNTTNDPCTTNENCISGKCYLGFCVLKGTSEDCTSSSQCLSGICKNNKCTKTDLWTNIDNAKTENFGSTTNTNNFIALILMTVGMVGIIIITKNVIGILAGVAFFIVSGIFFAIVGWLSIFIIFGIILLIAIMIFVVIIMKGNT